MYSRCWRFESNAWPRCMSSLLSLLGFSFPRFLVILSILSATRNTVLWMWWVQCYMFIGVQNDAEISPNDRFCGRSGQMLTQIPNCWVLYCALKHLVTTSLKCVCSFCQWLLSIYQELYYFKLFVNKWFPFVGQTFWLNWGFWLVVTISKKAEISTRLLFLNQKMMIYG